LDRRVRLKINAPFQSFGLFLAREREREREEKRWGPPNLTPISTPWRG